MDRKKCSLSYNPMHDMKMQREDLSQSGLLLYAELDNGFCFRLSLDADNIMSASKSIFSVELLQTESLLMSGLRETTIDVFFTFKSRSGLRFAKELVNGLMSDRLLRVHGMEGATAGGTCSMVCEDVLKTDVCFRRGAAEPIVATLLTLPLCF